MMPIKDNKVEINYLLSEIKTKCNFVFFIISLLVGNYAMERIGWFLPLERKEYNIC